MITVQVKSAGVEEWLKNLTLRSNSLTSFLNKNVVAQYRNLQRKRWMTENQSEAGTPPWMPLNPTYRTRKLKQFQSYPGRGTKMLVATNTLFKSVIGPGEGFRKIVTPKQLILGTTIPYATHVDELRTFTTWGDESRKIFSEMITDYIFKNRIRTYTNV